MVAAATALRFLSAGAMCEIVLELGEAYTRASGTKLSGEFTRSPLVRDRIRSGEAFDIVVTTKSNIEQLVRENKVLSDSAAVLARSHIGVAVKLGRPKPDISTVGAFINTLRNAKSIACADPAFGTASGLHLTALFDRLGLTAELKPKLHLVGAVGGEPVVVCAAVADGKAELGIQQIAEIVAVPGVEVVGPLPAELQHTTEFGVAVSSATRNADLARSFVAFLTAEAAKPIIASHGMEPA
jgi:molybdate transport system substrate-binding protein